jgi:hypothetical protein
MEGIPEVGLRCLVDSGALHNRFNARYSEIAGIDLDDAESESNFAIAAAQYSGRICRVALSIGEFTWEAPVCFVPDWPYDFQILGQEGFFRFFNVCFHAVDEYLTLAPAAH